MDKKCPYGFGKNVEMPFDEVVDRVRATLREQQFKLMSEIDVTRRFKEDLGMDFRRYRILGACNPHVAYKALSTEIDMGLLFPCNVAIYEESPGKTTVMAVDPVVVFGFNDSVSLQNLLIQIRDRLKLAIDKV